MSNRESLRKLSRKFPAPPEVEKILDSLRDENDLHVAILASSIVEASLERLLASKLKSRSSNLIGQIFNNRGPLSDFHSKILIAHAFHIITPAMAEELHSIKAVRNAFAHAKIPISFDHENIAAEVQNLRIGKALKLYGENPSLDLKLTNKNSFLLIVRILLIIIEGCTEHKGTAFEAIKLARDSST